MSKPPREQKTSSEQAYEIIKPELDELVGVSGGGAADSPVISYFKGKYSELTKQARARLSAP